MDNEKRLKLVDEFSKDITRLEESVTEITIWLAGREADDAEMTALRETLVPFKRHIGQMRFWRGAITAMQVDMDEFAEKFDLTWEAMRHHMERNLTAMKWIQGAVEAETYKEFTLD